MKFLKHCFVWMLLLACFSFAQAGTWTKTTNNPPGNVSAPLLLTDGTVMIQNPNTSSWYKLTPDVNGDYVNGTWTTLASMVNAHSPLYFASAVLKDGRVVVCGGEYNGSGSGVWTTKCSIYNPVTNVWTSFAPPAGWAEIGDAQCAVMPDGSFMLAHILDSKMARLDPNTLTWTNLTPTGKVDRFDEEGWTLLPDGTILTVDAIGAPHAEKYIPWLNTWVSAGNTPAPLADAGSQELGPQILMYDGRVLATGATVNNAIYTAGALSTDPGSWVSAPSFPGTQKIADGPACLLPGGNVLVATSPGVFTTPTTFYEYNGSAWVSQPTYTGTAGKSCYQFCFLMLPNGQVLSTFQGSTVFIYSSTGAPSNAWRPTISTFPAAVSPGSSYTISGTQFNGLSQCSVYGDDAGMDTNYPLVRITNTATGHMKYCRTHDHSTMGVATGSTPVSTQFDVPVGIETGPSTLVVIANGIASTAVALNVGLTPTITSITPNSTPACGPTFTLTVNGSNFSSGDTVKWTNGSTTALATTFVNSSTLTATVPAALIALPGNALVFVASGAVNSNNVSFTITQPVPIFSTLSPNSTTVGNPGQTINLGGNCFTPQSVVQFVNQGGTVTLLPTTYISQTALSAIIPASLMASAGINTIRVFNPTPAGGTSGSLTFTVNNPLPVITTISPSSVISLSGSFTLNLSGSGFLPGSLVLWNGSLLTSTYVNSTTLTASVPGSLIATSGSANVVVANGAPGGGTSNVMQVTINPTVINGRVILEDYSGGGTWAAEVKILQGSTVVATQTVTLGAGGNYSFSLDIAPGTYDVLVAVQPHWLARKVAGVVVSGGTGGVAAASLINGDIDGDNEIGPSDFGALSTAYGSVAGDSNWNPNADLDGDGEVGPSDFGILSTNYGLLGDTP